MLTDRGMDQINIHHLVALENYDQLMETLNDSITDSRLEKLNAIVMLSLKKCGRGKGYSILPQEKFKKVIDFSMSNNVTVGFDSCSCHRFLDAVKGSEDYERIEMMAEPCESSAFSVYISAEGKFYPCSFAEDVKEFGEGLDVANCDDFIKDIWMHDKTVKFRNKLLSGNRECPIYKIYDKK
jgi:MoaA/NifB/PqqE/SkfB family radical SAM enzyme